ncbi:hypothetical protein, partial [Alicyclobacillus shizuokensis]|uniref:hypothetical protein n=1 Tax=Alicyclobacillus shizuokensis TaxID=392014 RepID=UPI001C3F4983
ISRSRVHGLLETPKASKTGGSRPKEHAKAAMLKARSLQFLIGFGNQGRTRANRAYAIFSAG